MQSSVAARGGLRSGDEILSINGAPVVGQRDVMFDLLDSVSSRGEAVLAVRGKDGATRSASLNVPDRDERVRLTEPAALLRGLGFEFWSPPLPAILGEVAADGPAARAGLKTGDQITAIDGERISDFREIVTRVSGRPCRVRLAKRRLLPVRSTRWFGDILAATRFSRGWKASTW